MSCAYHFEFYLEKDQIFTMYPNNERSIFSFLAN